MTVDYRTPCGEKIMCDDWTEARRSRVRFARFTRCNRPAGHEGEHQRIDRRTFAIEARKP